MKQLWRYKSFTLQLVDEQLSKGARTIVVKTTDRFHSFRHKPERFMFKTSVTLMEKYLRSHPELTFEDPKNHIRKIIYLPPAMRAWTAYMPDGFATHHVHNPDHPKLVSGKKIDYMTRNLFRHSADAIGLRSRAYAMAWFIRDHFKKDTLTWLSIASGTGQPTFDAVDVFGGNVTIHLADINDELLSFAKQLAHSYNPNWQVATHHADVTDTVSYTKLLKKLQPNVIEAMGIVEYLSNEQIVAFVGSTYEAMKAGDLYIFTNMRPSHPHLHTHQRGLGWPGVKQRTVEQIMKLITTAGVPDASVTVILPTDNVYGVYAIIK